MNILTFFLAFFICHSFARAVPIAKGHISFEKLVSTKNAKFYSTPLKNSQGTTEYVLTVLGGKVYEIGIIFTADDHLIEEVIVLNWGKSIDEHKLLKQHKKFHSPKSKSFNGRLAVITSAGAENYYHWMFQILPRIKILKESKVPFDMFYFYKLDKPYQFETLKKLGIEKSNIILGEPDQILVAKELVVPSIPVWPAKGKTFSPWVIDYLKSSLLNPSNSQKFPKKIFISRKKASIRNIINEEAVVKALSDYGYHKVFLEDYTVQDQVQMFSQAKSVIGVHGSGLTNIAFCESNTKIIELNPVAGHQGPYALLAKERGLIYRMIDTSAENLTEKQFNQEDLVVPIEKLLQVVKECDCLD